MDCLTILRRFHLASRRDHASYGNDDSGKVRDEFRSGEPRNGRWRERRILPRAASDRKSLEELLLKEGTNRREANSSQDRETDEDGGDFSEQRQA
jgi:hypothetical protein